jgi:hypothetical protein
VSNKEQYYETTTTTTHGLITGCHVGDGPFLFGLPVGRVLEGGRFSQTTNAIIANWKLHPQTSTEAITLAFEIAALVKSSSPDADRALFVPYRFIVAVKKAVGDRLEVAAQVS